jgi:hypothetical protein
VSDVLSTTLQPATPAPRVIKTQLLTRGNQVVGFVIRFNTPMDPSSTQDPRNYHAYQITQPNKYVARLLYQSDRPKATSLPIRSAVYLSSADAVVLWLSTSRKMTGKFRVELANPAVPKGPARARLKVPVLADAAGIPLQGPKGPLGNPLLVPIMLVPGSSVQVHGLSRGTLPI